MGADPQQDGLLATIPPLMRFLAHVERDILDAEAWLSAQNPDLGRQFRAAIDAALARIEEGPARWPKGMRGTRRYIVTKFKYVVVYREKADEVVIVAVTHGRRSPGHWKDRLKDLT